MDVTTHEMFMLFFSILYGIMLNAAIGLQAFPVGRALYSLFKRNKSHEDLKCLVRLITAVLIFNVFPFIYFATIFYYLRPLVFCPINWGFWVTVIRILIIGLLSIGVFGFYRFYHYIMLIRWHGRLLLYSECELINMKKKRGLCMDTKAHLFGSILYFAIPVLLGLLSGLIAIN